MGSPFLEESSQNILLPLALQRKPFFVRLCWWGEHGVAAQGWDPLREQTWLVQDRAALPTGVGFRNGIYGPVSAGAVGL